MHCRACDIPLTDYETTRKSAITNHYYDLCNNCFKTIKDDVNYKDRADLRGDIDDLDSEDLEHY